MWVGLLTDKIKNKLEKNNLIKEQALSREPVPLIIFILEFHQWGGTSETGVSLRNNPCLFHSYSKHLWVVESLSTVCFSSRCDYRNRERIGRWGYLKSMQYIDSWQFYVSFRCSCFFLKKWYHGVDFVPVCESMGVGKHLPYFLFGDIFRFTSAFCPLYFWYFIK